MSRLYLDHAATTPILPAARDAVAEGMARWANPSSPHAEGRAARRALEDARERMKAALGWTGELIFTSGASEALAIALTPTVGRELFVSAVEHDAVFRAATDAVRLPVDSAGRVQLDVLEERLVRSIAPVVAVQQVNSETGVLQPLEEIGARVRAAGGVLIVDAAQGAAKLPLPDAHLVIVSAHKLGGPPGVGALLVRDLALLRPAGGQEFGYRGGTENLPGVLGFAAALEAPTIMPRLSALRKECDAAIVAAGGEVVAAAAARLPSIGAYRMPGVSATAQLVRFDLAGIAVSAGSACASGSLKPSHVLHAMGLAPEAAAEVIRVSFGWNTMAGDVDRFTAEWRRIAGDAIRRAA